MKNEQYIKNEYNWQDLQNIVHILRQPDGCSWDSVQTYESLKDCVINETNEVIEAVNNKDFLNLKEELGDLLLQVVMYSEIAKERDEFTLEDVINCVASKMVKRHPNVFNDGLNDDVEEYNAMNISHWNQIKLKRKERAIKRIRKIISSRKN